ncbi:fimbrial protein [Photobacterium damselae]|uniref:fimbrial protein n=1 Tax=Photobacterium damselae TaxID=38293 RepID=UPI0040688314
MSNKMFKSNFILIVMLFFLSGKASAFDCKSEYGSISQFGGSAKVIVDLTPEVQLGQNLVVDLTNKVWCKNLLPKKRIDYLRLTDKSTFSGKLDAFRGSMTYNGMSYPIPLDRDTERVEYSGDDSYKSVPLVLYLSPVSAPAGGILIKKGDKIADLYMIQNGKNLVHPCLFCGGTGDTRYIWKVIANNDVVIPTGGCDISNRDVTVDLGEYSGSNKKHIDLSVHCAKAVKLEYFLSGDSEPSDNTIFSNTASSNKAQGFGVRIFDKKNNPINNNVAVELGTVGDTEVDLGLSADFATFGPKQTPGNVSSVINVNFQYM